MADRRDELAGLSAWDVMLEIFDAVSLRLSCVCVLTVCDSLVYFFFNLRYVVFSFACALLVLLVERLIGDVTLRCAEPVHSHILTHRYTHTRIHT